MVLVRKSGGSRLLVKARCKWENNTNVELKETGRKGVDWITVAGCCEHSYEPMGFSP
jgi:hypothetical protein